MSVVVLVALIVVPIVVVVGVLVTVLVTVLRRRSRERLAELKKSFPDARMGPELGNYRGGTGSFSRVNNTSWIVLTPTALAIRPLLGKAITVPTADVTGARIAKSFIGQRTVNPVLVLETAHGELGVTVADPEEWRRALVR